MNKFNPSRRIQKKRKRKKKEEDYRVFIEMDTKPILAELKNLKKTLEDVEKMQREWRKKK